MVKLKKIILAVLMLVIGIGNIFAEDDITIITTTQLSFMGKIANSNIHMYLNQDDNNKLFGTYYYDAYKIAIPVKGYIAPNGVIKLTEYDENGKYRAVFEGMTVSPGKIEGVWYDNFLNLEKEKPYQFYLIRNGTEDNSISYFNPSWEGDWTREGTRFNKAFMKISRKTENSFYFDIRAFYGAHIGFASGLALIKGNSAVFTNNEGGGLEFKLENDKITVVKQGTGMPVGGIGVFFSGTYAQGDVKPEEVNFVDHKILTPAQETIFKEMTGQYYEKFQNTLHIRYEENDLDGFGAKVYRVGVRGIFSFIECIIMIADGDKMWAAVIDGDNIRYFTNTAQTKTLPLTIKKWCEKLVKYSTYRPIIYQS